MFVKVQSSTLVSWDWIVRGQVERPGKVSPCFVLTPTDLVEYMSDIYRMELAGRNVTLSPEANFPPDELCMYPHVFAPVLVLHYPAERMWCHGGWVKMAHSLMPLVRKRMRHT